MSDTTIGFFYMHSLVCTCCVAEMIEDGSISDVGGVLIDADGNKAEPASSWGYPDGFTCADCDWNVGPVE